MSLADNIFIDMCKDVIENGTSTEGEKVRPVWEDVVFAFHFLYSPACRDQTVELFNSLKSVHSISKSASKSSVTYSLKVSLSVSSTILFLS